MKHSPKNGAAQDSSILDPTKKSDLSLAIAIPAKPAPKSEPISFTPEAQFLRNFHYKKKTDEATVENVKEEDEKTTRPIGLADFQSHHNKDEFYVGTPADLSREKARMRSKYS